MVRPLLIVSALLAAVSLFAAQETQTQENKAAETKPSENKATVKTPAPANDPVPVTAARQANPVKPSPESLAAGKKIYRYDCSLCHGDTGDGKGDSSQQMKVPDFTNPATFKDRTDGELFYVIKNGRGDMPPEGDRMKPDQLWNMVNYVRSLARKKAPTEEKATN